MNTRRFQPRFSIRSLFVVVALCAALAGVEINYQRHQHTRHVERAHRIANAALAAEHSDPAGMAGALNAIVANLQLSARPTYLLATGKFKDGGTPDDFETNLLSKLEAGVSTDVVIRYAGSDAVIYYKVIRWTATCRNCHSTDAGEGEVMAVMKLAL